MYKKRVTHGLSIQDILTRGIGGFDEGTARQMLTRLVSAANKRIARMEKGGETSTALQQVKATGGKFSSRGKSGEELQKEFSRIKTFLETPTSTIREVRAEKRKSAKAQQKPKERQKPKAQQKPKAKKKPQAPQKTKAPAVSDIIAKNGLPSDKDLRKMTTILISAANKRLKRMGGDAKREKFSIAGKTLDEVKRVFKEVKAFLESPQGGKKAINKMQAEVIRRLEMEHGIIITPDQYDVLFRSYEELRKIDKKIIEKEMKYTVLKNIMVALNLGNDTVDSIVSKIAGKTQEIYEENERTSHAFDGVSGFFGA